MPPHAVLQIVKLCLNVWTPFDIIEKFTQDGKDLISVTEPIDLHSSQFKIMIAMKNLVDAEEIIYNTREERKAI